MLQLLKEMPTLIEALNREDLGSLMSSIRISEVAIGAEKFRYHRMHSSRLVSDSCEYHGADAVFPLHPESIFLSLTIPPAPPGGLYMDVGCGSGVLPVAAARKGWNAHALDINPRALALSQVSAQLSGVSLTCVQGDIRTFTPGQGFDFITINMPFEPTGGLGSNFIHSDGGMLGDELSIAALMRLPALLSPGGKAVLISFSLLQGSRSTLETWLRSNRLPGFKVTLLRLSGAIGLDPLLWRYGPRDRTQVGDVLRAQGYEEFVIEAVAVLPSTALQPPDVLNAPVANPDWIYPLGEHTLTVTS